MNGTPPVGVGERVDPLARSALGSTSGGAAERREAEGVRFVGWYKPLISAVPVGVD